MNPPGRDVYIRDYYCSKTSRTNYTFPPIDLLHAGGKFRLEGWDICAVDAIVEGLSPQAAIARACELAPDAVFTLVGAVSVDEDATFLKALRAALPPGTPIIGSGDVLLEHGRDWVENGTLDAAALDFAATSIVRFAAGEREGLFDLIYRDGERVLRADKNPERDVSVGVPPHELFVGLPYRFPFARRRPITSLLTDYGCPFRCTFCVMAGLHYHRRPLEEVAEELAAMKAAGVKEFVIWDQTFAVDRKRGLAFLELLPEGRDRFGWTCFIRPDRIDKELAELMVAKGCHTAMMGVESAKPETLVDIKKDFTVDDVRQAMAVCRAAGLDVVATAIVGLPGETEADVTATMEFMCEVDPDYVSVHTAIPRNGTQLRAGMKEDGLIGEDTVFLDQAGEQVAVASNALDAETILTLRRRFNRRFHLRAGYLARMAVKRLREPGLLLEQIRHGMTLLGRNA